MEMKDGDTQIHTDMYTYMFAYIATFSYNFQRKIKF